MASTPSQKLNDSLTRGPRLVFPRAGCCRSTLEMTLIFSSIGGENDVTTLNCSIDCITGNDATSFRNKLKRALIGLERVFLAYSQFNHLNLEVVKYILVCLLLDKFSSGLDGVDIGIVLGNVFEERFFDILNLFLQCYFFFFSRFLRILLARLWQLSSGIFF